VTRYHTTVLNSEFVPVLEDEDTTSLYSVGLDRVQ